MEEFKNKVKEALERNMGHEYVIEPVKVCKKNDIFLHGLVCSKENIRCGITIYLQEYFQAYQEGKTIEEVAESIAKWLESERENSEQVEKLKIYNSLWDYERVKDKIIFGVLNTDRNTEFLKNTVSMKTNLDISIYFCVMVEFSDDVIGTTNLLQGIFDVWSITENELLALAKENTKRLFPHEFVNIGAFVNTLMKEDDFSQVMNPPEVSESFPMYVLTNQKKNCGAAALFYDGLLRNISEELNTEQLIILPSSRHEILVVLVGEIGKDTDELRSMVREINATQVAREDFLSDNIYRYDRSTDTICIIPEKGEGMS